MCRTMADKHYTISLSSWFHYFTCGFHSHLFYVNGKHQAKSYITFGGILYSIDIELTIADSMKICLQQNSCFKSISKNRQAYLLTIFFLDIWGTHWKLTYLTNLYKKIFLHHSNMGIIKKLFGKRYLENLF